MRDEIIRFAMQEVVEELMEFAVLLVQSFRMDFAFYWIERVLSAVVECGEFAGGRDSTDGERGEG